jgi:hypothetical protein
MKIKSILFTLAAAGTFSAHAFEGTILQKYMMASNPAADIKVSWTVKNGKCALTMSMKQEKANATTHFIPLKEAMQLITYNEGAGNTFKMLPVQQIKEGPEMNFSRMEVKQTNETKNIFGINCKKVLIITNEHSTEAWVTVDDQAAYYQYAAFFRSALDFQGLNKEKIGGFPVQFETRDLSGKVILKAECTGVQPGSISDAAFKAPAGYTPETK